MADEKGEPYRWEVLVLVGEVDLDHEIKVAQVIVRGCGRIRTHHKLTLLLYKARPSVSDAIT